MRVFRKADSVLAHFLLPTEKLQQDGMIELPIKALQNRNHMSILSTFFIIKSKI